MTPRAVAAAVLLSMTASAALADTAGPERPAAGPAPAAEKLGTLSLVENGLTADFCINGEPTDLQVMTCHVGVTQLRVRATGVGVHVCRRDEGRNALAELLPAVAALDERCLAFEPHPDYPGLPTINVGKVGGGTMASMHAAEAEAFVDVRSVPGMTPESVLSDIRAAIAAARKPNGEAPDVEVSLIERPAFCQQHPYIVDRGHPVVAAVADAHASLFGARPYVGPLFPQVYFGTDASHLNRAGIATVNVYTVAGAALCRRT